MAIPLLDDTFIPKRLLADKAYEANILRHRLSERNVQAVIPFSAARTVPYPLDRRAYKRRNIIEPAFGKLEN